MHPSLDEGLALAARLGVGVQMDVKEPGVEEGVVDGARAAAACSTGASSARSRSGSLRAFAALEPGLPRSLTYPEDRLGV